jgi:hypothetical protein
MKVQCELLVKWGQIKIKFNQPLLLYIPNTKFQQNPLTSFEDEISSSLHIQSKKNLISQSLVLPPSKLVTGCRSSSTLAALVP